MLCFETQGLKELLVAYKVGPIMTNQSHVVPSCGFEKEWSKKTFKKFLASRTLCVYYSVRQQQVIFTLRLIRPAS